MIEIIPNNTRHTRNLILLTAVTLCVITDVCRMDISFSGDLWSDLNVLMAGKNFEQYGFNRLHFLPVYQNTPLSERPPYYLHYPPLGELMNGGLRCIGCDSVRAYRFIAGLASLAGVIFFYKALAPLLGQLATVCGLLFFVTTPFFLKYSCSIHSHSYNILYSGLFLHFLFLATRDGAGWRPWAGCWLVLFTASLNSFEFLLFLHLFTGAYLLLSGKLKRYYPALILLAIAPVAGVGLHFLQNCLAIGLDNALADNLGFTFRHGGLNASRWAALTQLPWRLRTWTTDYYNLSWLEIMVITGLSPLILRRKQRDTRLGALLWSSLAATGSWYLFMPSHAIVHAHTSGQFTLMAIIAAGVIADGLWQTLSNRQAMKETRLFALAILTAITGLQVYYSAKCFYKDNPAAANVALHQAIGASLPDRCGLIVNSNLAGPYLPYYSGKPVVEAWGAGIDIPGKCAELQAMTSRTLDGYYFVYQNSDYRNDRLFDQLASDYPGYLHALTNPQSKTVTPIILFDLNPSEDIGNSITEPQKTEQLNGLFPDWPEPKPAVPVQTGSQDHQKL